MKQRYTKKELYELRNFIPVNDLIRELKIPCKFDHEGRFRFLCPTCNEFTTSTKADTNLARCFRCEENFNTIELTIVYRRQPFVEAVEFLKAFYRDIEKNRQRSQSLSTLLEQSVKGFE